MRLFSGKHLSQVEETYMEHCRFGLWAGVVLGTLSILSLIHAIFPFLFPRLPDKLYQYFVTKATPRLTKVNQILKDKKIE
jgi:hypothetical protein